MCMGVLPVCMHVFHCHLVPVKARRGQWRLWNWSLRQLGAANGCWEWNLGLWKNSKCRAISPASTFSNYNTIREMLGKEWDDMFLREEEMAPEEKMAKIQWRRWSSPRSSWVKEVVWDQAFSRQKADGSVSHWSRSSRAGWSKAI